MTKIQGCFELKYDIYQFCKKGKSVLKMIFIPTNTSFKNTFKIIIKN